MVFTVLAVFLLLDLSNSWRNIRIKYFRLKSQNHSESIRYYLHPTIAKLFDIILTVFLFSLAIIMTAGGASTINESFGLPFWLSSSF